MFANKTLDNYRCTAVKMIEPDPCVSTWTNLKTILSDNRILQKDVCSMTPFM